MEAQRYDYLLIIEIMESIINLKERAESLRKKYQADSITPEEVGGLFADTLDHLGEVEYNLTAVGIRKVYGSVDEMEADTAPEDAKKRLLQYGQLVAIYADGMALEDCGVYAWQDPGWLPVGRIGSIEITIVQEGEGAGVTPEQAQDIAKIPAIEQMAKEATPVFTAVVKNVSVVNSTTQLAQEVVWNETTGRFVARLRGSGSLSYTYYAAWTANDAVASSESYNVRDRVYRMGTDLFAIVGGGLTKVVGSNLVIE